MISLVEGAIPATSWYCSCEVHFSSIKKRIGAATMQRPERYGNPRSKKTQAHSLTLGRFGKPAPQA
jgi:hypothetical protein